MGFNYLFSALDSCFWHTCPQISKTTHIAKFMEPNGAHRGPVGPRWAPCWPHEPCYLGIYVPHNKRLALSHISKILATIIDLVPWSSGDLMMTCCIGIIHHKKNTEQFIFYSPNLGSCMPRDARRMTWQNYKKKCVIWYINNSPGWHEILYMNYTC